MPYKSEGRKNYPNVKYDLPEATEDPAWLDAARAFLLRDEYAAGQVPLADVPRAEVVELQSADEFSAFTPMERIATAAETKALLASPPRRAVSPLSRGPDGSRSAWRTICPPIGPPTDPGGTVRGEAARGEYFTFQIGVWAAREPITDLEVRFSDLVQSLPRIEDGSPAAPTLIPAKSLTCFNKGGVDWDGSPIKKTLPVERGKVQALWCGVPVPALARPGVFRGTVTIAPNGSPGDDPRRRAGRHRRCPCGRRGRRPVSYDPAALARFDPGPGRRRRPALHGPHGRSASRSAVSDAP